VDTKETLKLLRDYESRNVTFVDPQGGWPIVWERARGVQVWDMAGKKYLDLTAAFGVAAAGHANPRVVRAGQRQMARLLHAMGDVHPHALKAQLARQLSRITFERWSVASAILADVEPGFPPSRRARAPLRRDDGPARRTKTRANPGALEFSHDPTQTTPVPGGKDAALHVRQGCLTPPSRQTFTATGKTIFANSGFEAVEAALKTALLATGKRGVIAFEGAYHGLGYGALNTTHRSHFRRPFAAQLGRFGHFVPFPKMDGCASQPSLQQVERALRRTFRREAIGAVLVEPVQARGGIHVPPPEFLPRLRQLCDEYHALLIFDEIYTGFGRTGKWFAGEHTRTVPDLICLGKALTGGFPLSACVGRADLMDAAWPASTGEAIHTSTFLGHPVGCAMALAQISEIEQRKLPARAAALGTFLLDELSKIQCSKSRLRLMPRGQGLLAGVELILPDGTPATQIALPAIKALLQRGYIFLPEGEHANVISFTPPLTVSQPQLAQAVAALADVLGVGTACPHT